MADVLLSIIRAHGLFALYGRDARRAFQTWHFVPRKRRIAKGDIADPHKERLESEIRSRVALESRFIALRGYLLRQCQNFRPIA